MAEDIEQLVVSLEARYRDFERNFQKASRSAKTNWSDIEAYSQKGAKKLESTFDQATKGISSKFKLMATSAAGALTAAFGVNELRKIADTWGNIRNQVAATGVPIDEVAGKMNQLADIAVKTKGSIEGVAGAYGSIKRAQSDLGASEAQVLAVTENLSRALALGGQGAEATKAALLQTGQALASGTLAGDELKSILENAPELAQAIARQMKVAVGQLKQLGSDGKITSKDLFEAILNSTDQLNAKWKTLTPTISQSVEMLKTELTRWVGTLDQATGASSALAGGIASIAGHMNVAGPAAAALAAAMVGFGVGGPIGAGVAGLSVAFAGLGSQIHPIAGELASLGDYAAVAFGLLKDQTVEAATMFQSAFAQAASYVQQALASVDGEAALQHLLDGAKTIANAVIGAFILATSKIGDGWRTLGIVITDSLISAMNSVIGAVEAAANRIGAIMNGLGANVAQFSFPRLTSTTTSATDALKRYGATAREVLGRDYIGEFNSAANRAAIQRTFGQRSTDPGKNDGALDQKLKNPAPKSSGGSSKSAKEKSPDEFQKEVADLEKKIRLLDMERDALGKEAVEVEKTKTAFDLLEAAKKANVAVTPELQNKINDLSGAYANAKVKLDEAKQKQEEWQSGIKSFGDDLKGAFESAILSGERLDKVFEGLLKKMASKAFEKGFDGIFSALSGNGNGGILSGLFSGLKLAGGGHVSGPGGPTSDSVPAMLSNGEFVMNAAATSKNLALLQALNSGRLPRFASGGVVGSAPTLPALSVTPAGAGGPVTVNTHVNVNANGGTPEQNRDLSKQIGAAVEQHARGVVADELRRQQRPGGLLFARYGR